MKKKYLIALSASIIFLLFLIPFIKSDIQNLNDIDKKNGSNFAYTKNIPNNFKQIHETNYNLILEQNTTLRYANKMLNEKKLNIGTSIFNLKQIESIGNNNEETFSYEQEYKGIPVYGGSLVLIKKNDIAVAIKNNYYTSINIDTKKRLSDEQINAIIGENLNVKLKNKFNNLTFKDINFSKINSTTVILPIQTDTDIEYKLVQKIDLPISKSPLASWTYFIDISSGKLIKKINKVIYENVNGSASGKIYPESPNQTMEEKSFSKNYVYLQKGTNRSLYSGSGNNLDATAITNESIDLKNVSSFATLSFSTRYKIESNSDFAYVWICTNTSCNPGDWELLHSYTGTQSEWINESIDITEYNGSDILLAFNYVTDNDASLEGFYLDNVKIDTDDGIKFQDDFENGSEKWDIALFSIVRSSLPVNSTYTNTNGFYNLYGEEVNSTIYSYLSGPFANIINMNEENDIFYDQNVVLPGINNWNWFDYDSSYKNEESNLFYHVNKAHDFFTRDSPFDITDMDYQLKVIYRYSDGLPEFLSTHCNAASISDGAYLIFFPELSGTCEALSLYSDVIYHEYTHAVVRKIYGSVELPYENQSGAINEGWADYFAASINNNSCMAEDSIVGLTCLRNLNNSKKYPDNITNEVHEDGEIFSGALWDLRSELSQDLSDNLTIKTMKLKAQNFSEYLDDMLFVDNNYSIPTKGSINWHQICSSFSKHGITSNFCSPIVLDYNQSIEMIEEETKNISVIWENPIYSTQTALHYCSPSFSNCNYYNYENSTEIQSGLSGNYTDNVSIDEVGTWKFFAYTLSDNINYTSNDYSITVFLNTVCGDSVCNGNESCSSCSSDCGICPVPSSGGGGGSRSKEKEDLIIINETQIKEGYSQELEKNQRIKFTLFNQEHYIGINAMNENSVIITINSTPKNATFIVGETKLFNLTFEDYYDLKITLNSLEDNKANLTVLEIYEAIQNISAIPEEIPIENNTNASFQDTSKIINSKNKIMIKILVASIIIITIMILFFKLVKFHPIKKRINNSSSKNRN